MGYILGEIHMHCFITRQLHVTSSDFGTVQNETNQCIDELEIALKLGTGR